ncbi:RDH16 dehydrogenase, partial [Urocolius indicus]|nr:RDH16 dehydrogenase [Urocolius indicus]
RLEMHNFGVKVSVIEPGHFQTAVTNSEILQKQFISLWEKVPEETKVAYGDNYCNKFEAAVAMFQKTCSPNLRWVTDCMEHALTSCHPRSRYSPGWDAKLLYMPLSYLPSAFTDTL